MIIIAPNALWRRQYRVFDQKEAFGWKEGEEKKKKRRRKFMLRKRAWLTQAPSFLLIRGTCRIPTDSRATLGMGGT